MKNEHDDYDGKAFLLFVVMVFLCVIIIGFVTPKNNSGDFELITIDTKGKDGVAEEKSSNVTAENEADKPFKVLSVIDGDTIKIDYFGSEEYVRLIGVNTPEIDGPYTKLECFGNEASGFTRSYLEGQWITIERDPSQANRDKYDRLLRYVYLAGVDFGGYIIEQGYGYEYTYNNSYNRRALYASYQDEAKSNESGLWGNSACVANSSSISGDYSDDEGYGEEKSGRITEDGTKCNIKGNISKNTGEKIYHVPGQEYYDETIISPEYGERWFCSEEEAIAAGWRRAKEDGGYSTNNGSSIDNSGDDNSKNEGMNDSDQDGSDHNNQNAYYDEKQDSSYSGEKSTSIDKKINTRTTSDKKKKTEMSPIAIVVFSVIVLTYVAGSLIWLVMLIVSIKEKAIAIAMLFTLLLVSTIGLLIAMIIAVVYRG